MKFDFVIGNPPYQDTTDSDSTRMPPIYNYFIDDAYKVSDKVELIHPARFLFNAGYTPKQWNEKMLNDEHLKVMLYEPDCTKIFDNTDIKGGIAITYHDNNKNYGSIGVFTKYNELNSILKKVRSEASSFLDSIIFPPLNYKLSDLMIKENPKSLDRLRTSAFTNLSEIFFSEIPKDGKNYIAMLGLLEAKRVVRFVRRDYIKDSSNILDNYNLIIAAVNGSGEFGETLSKSIVAEPNTAYTQTFMAIGNCKTYEEAVNIGTYIKTKFARALLGVLKITQHCSRNVWKYVPLQNFTPDSDIDWSVSVADIDKQLYKKYGLSPEEIEFIETHVKEMV